jgi:tetratricopeptide (TPR) repeat protein
MKRALELNPWSSFSRLGRGLQMMAVGRMKEAIAGVESSLEIDPLSTWNRGWLAELLDLDRQYERGLKEAMLVIETDPSHWFGYLAAGHLLRDMQKYGEAIAILGKLSDSFGGKSAVVLGSLGQVLADSGDTAGARRVIEALHELASQV